MAGAATVGRLVIDLAANVAQLRTDMQAATGVVEQAGATMTSAVGSVKTALGALGVAFSIGEVKAWAGDVISSTAALNDFSQKTGSSVENLSKLANQAAVSGKDFATLEQLTLRLAVNMRDMGDDTKAAGAALAYLGVTSKDPAEALMQVAVAMEGYADGAGKAALAKDLFGKNGPQYIDFLHDLAQAHGVGATRTAEQAKAADELEEGWRRLKVEGTFFADIVLNTIVPALLNGVTAFNNLRAAGFGFFGILTGPVSVTEAISALVDAQEKLEKINAQMAAQAAAGNNGLVNVLRQQAAAAQDDVEKHEKLVAAYLRTSTTVDTEAPKMQANYGRVAAGAKAAHEASESFLGAINALNLEFNKITGAGGGGSEMEKALLAIDKALRDGKIVTNESIDAYVNWAKKVDEAKSAKERFIDIEKIGIERAKEEQKALEEHTKQLNEQLGIYVRFYDVMQDVVESNEIEVASLGLSADQIRVNNELRRIDIELRRTLHDLSGEAMEDARNAAIAAAEEAKASVVATAAKISAYQQWADLMQSATAGVKNFILDFVENGSSAFKRLWQNFRDWALAALAEIAAKQIVVSIVGALGIGGAGGAQAASGLSLGQGGNLLSSIFNLGGGGGLTGVGGMAEGLGTMLFGDALGGSAFAAGMGSPIGTITTLLGGEGGAAIGAGLGLEAGLGAAVPVAGVALGVYMLGKQLGWWDKGGGPKEEGFGQAGDISISPFEGGQTAAASASAKSLAEQTLAGYNAALKLLGGTGTAGFAIQFNQDPAGDSASRGLATATVNGQTVYNADTGETLSRDTAQLAEQLKTEASKALLAALKASDLPEIVGQFLGLVDLGTSTIETIVGAAAMLTALPEELQTKFMAAIKLDPSVLASMAEFASAYVNLQEVLNIDPQAAVLKAVAGAQQTNFEKVLQLRTGLEQLVTTYDGSAAGTNALADATREYVNAQIAALSEIQQLKTSLSGLFGNSIEQIGMALMDAQTRSNFLVDEARKTMNLLRETTDPTNIDKFARLINKDLVDAFNLLSPDQQRANQAMFLNLLEQANAATVEQLDASKDAVLQGGEGQVSIMATIRDNLNAAAEKQFSAATKLEQVADAMLAASWQSGQAAMTQQAAAEQIWISANAIPSNFTVTVVDRQP